MPFDPNTAVLEEKQTNLKFDPSTATLEKPSVANILEQRQKNETENAILADNAAHPIRTAINKTTKDFTHDLATIPAHFVNQLLLNYPRYLSEKKGYKYPEATSGVGNILAKTAGVAGGIKNPIFGALKVTPASSLLKQSIAGAATSAAYAQPMKDRPVSAAVGAVLPGATNVAGKVLSKIPNATKFVSGRIVNSLIRPLLKDFSYGKNPGLGVAREGIVANSLDDLAQKISVRRKEVGKQIGSVLTKSAKMVDVRGVLRPLDVALARARKAPETNAALITRLEGLRNDLRGITGGTKMQVSNVGEAFKMKKQVGDLTKWTGNVSDDKLVNKSLKMVYGRLKQRIESVVPEIAPLNERYANLTSAEVATLYRDKIASRQNMIGLAPKVSGYGGAIYGLASGNPAAVLAGIGIIGVDKLLASPALKTRLAAGLYKLSEVDKAKVFKQFPKLTGALTSYMERPLLPNRTKDYIKNIRPGLSIEDVGGMYSGKNPKMSGKVAGKNDIITPMKAKDINLNKAQVKGTPAERFLAENPQGSAEVLNNINPTGGIVADYSPQKRATMKLGDNITTLDKTMEKSPDEIITIYRGAPNNQRDIVAGDFITTNRQLAKDYAGNGVVLEKKVKISDILDDKTEPLGEEYIYRPSQYAEAKGKLAKTAGEGASSGLLAEAKKYKTAEEFVDKQKYFRRSNSSTGERDAPWQMFSTDRERVKKYGKYEFFTDDSGAIEAEAIIPDIEEALNNHPEILEEYGATAEELAREANLSNIVSSAGIWDNLDLTQIIWDEVLEPKNILKIKTPDGIIVFDNSLIKTKSQLTSIWNKAQGK